MVSSMHRQVPPHYVFGYSLAEWLTLLSILGLFIGAISWIFRVVIIAPLNYEIDNLSHRIEDMGSLSQRQSAANEELLRQHTELLRDHDRMLTRHEEDIHTLFKNGRKQIEHEE